jgi:D-3-phosphoglycerate dehydrogenase / 2-oxoglutarate reductase
MEAVGVEKIETYFELAALCDVISVHLPKIPKTDFDPGTVDIINEEFLSKMKCDGTLINTSRGDLVDDDALIAKLDACPKFYAAVDVYRGEPQVKECEFVHPFGKHDRVYTTHHIGASTKQSEAAIGEEALRIVKKFGATKVPSNVINYGKFVKKA